MHVVSIIRITPIALTNFIKTSLLSYNSFESRDWMIRSITHSNTIDTEPITNSYVIFCSPFSFSRALHSALSVLHTVLGWFSFNYLTMPDNIGYSYSIAHPTSYMSPSIILIESLSGWLGINLYLIHF